MKTIVFSGNTAWSMYNFRLEVLREFKRKGHRVVVVSPHDAYSNRLKEEFEVYSVYMDNDGTNPFKEIRTLFSYYKLYKRIKPDFIFHYTIKPNIYGSIAAHWLNIPTLAVVTGLGYVFTGERLIKKIVEKMYKLSLRYAEKVWFLNSDDKKLFIEKKLIDKDKADVLPGEGIDTTLFAPVENREKTNVFRFLFIARLIRDKGILEYISAARKLKKKYNNVNFMVLGPVGVANPTAVPESTLNDWIEEGIINYLGTTDDVRDYISSSDCIVLPTYREGLPRVVLEALSMEKPVIATDAPGCRDIVDDGIDGLLCRIKDAIDLSEKMEKMINLPLNERIEMGKRGRKKVINRYSFKTVIDMYNRTLEKYLKLDI